MRGPWITILPLIAATALVLWGGERLSRRTQEDRIPADRDRLFDFTAAFRGELDRLDQLFNQHLLDLASNSDWLDQSAVTRRCEDLISIRTLTVFDSAGKRSNFTGVKPPLGTGTRVPLVVAESEQGRVQGRNTVAIPEEVFAASSPTQGWLPSPNQDHRIRWIRVPEDRLAVFVIDQSELSKALKKHFAIWKKSPLKPLLEAGESVAIEGPGGDEWLSPSSVARTGPAAMVLPHRTSLGDWQVLAWDNLTTSKTHDSATLIISGSIGCLLLLTGIALQIQQGRALRLAEERVSFVNRVSHELGTPLTNILLNVDLASRAIDHKPKESHRRLSLVNEEVQRLGRLITNVLTFSRSERRALELTPDICIPDEIIETVIRQFQPSLDRRKVEVEWRGDAAHSTRLAADALAQIVGNLISNVEKYASSGGWLGIESRLLDDRLSIQVRDHGPGIPVKQQKRVFQAFERVHTGLREGSSGTGLGLTIARDLARTMGGELNLIPSSSGAVFEINVPAPAHLKILPNESVA